MKQAPPSSESMVVFFKVKLAFIGMIVLAFIVWEAQDFTASFASAEMTTSATLRTTEERDDARVLRAFAEARSATHVDATLVTEKNPEQRTRDSVLTVTTKSKHETLEGREAIVNATRAAFAREGRGELFDISGAPFAKPVQNEAYVTVKQTCQWTALAILLVALVMLTVQWRHSNLPRGALFGILAAGFFLALFLLQEEGFVIWQVLAVAGLPAGVLALVGALTLRVRRAAMWVEGRARIVKSEIEVRRHRFAGDTTQVKNLPAVEYDFTVGSKAYHGDRISIGFQPADNVDEVLKRYPVGGEVPVFYDPANPSDCVLERKPPVSLGCLWSGTLFALLVYEAVVFGLWNVTSISAAFDARLSVVHHPLIVIGAGLLGLFCLVVGIWNMLHPRKAHPWLRTRGRIVSSETESYEDSDSASSSSRTRTYYRPVIEFSYTVDGHEYHNTKGSTDIVTIKISGGRSLADAEVARYPKGTEVDVFYDPANPTQSGLNVDTEAMITGRHSLIVAVILIAVAIYAALH